MKEINQKNKVIPDIIRKIDRLYIQDMEGSNPDESDAQDFKSYLINNDITDAEAFFCPEDEHYHSVLNLVKDSDVIWEIGAGDLRLALLLSQRVKQIYALEIIPDHLIRAMNVIGLLKPKNLTIIWGNGFTLPIPREVTKIVCLMMHRSHEFSKEMKERTILYATQNAEMAVLIPNKKG